MKTKMSTFMHRKLALTTLVISTALGASAANAASVTDITTASDDIVFGSSTGNVALTVMGNKNMEAGNVADNAVVGSWRMKTVDNTAVNLALAFDPSQPVVSGAPAGSISATVTSAEGKKLNIYTLLENSAAGPLDGVNWRYTKSPVTTALGNLMTTGAQVVNAGSYKVVMKAAIYHS